MKNSSMGKSVLPAPRLQLRWEPYKPTGNDDAAFSYNWACFYELVIPLNEYDGRRSVYENGEEVGSRTEMVLSFPGFTKVGMPRGTPCEWNGEKFADTPFRDGAHAQWDSVALGGIPIFVIAPDGAAYPVTRKDGSSPLNQEKTND